MQPTDTSHKITVLGKSFDSEEERRAYFREELRKKLPELKQMEGFPIGEDKDIINLSDPPYYTACPNPWLNDFIDEWEDEKKELEKEGKRKADFEVDAPFASDVSEGKNNPIYMAHSYHTKVPHPAIMRYILHYTQPGDIVFDGFAGTGMTGVASSQCGIEESSEKNQINNELIKENKRFQWGLRHCINSDLGTVASFIASNYNTKISLSDFESDVKSAIGDIKNELKWMYETIHTNGKVGWINYTVWSEIFGCPNCANEINFFRLAVNRKTKAVKSEFPCEDCGFILNKNNLNRLFETKYDSSTGESFKMVKIEPALINYIIGKKRFEKEPDIDDYNKINKINDLDWSCWFPTNHISKGDKTNELLRLGIENIHKLYTKRNLYVLSRLYEELNLNSSKLVHNSINTTLTSLLVRYNLGKRGNGILTGTFYLPSLIAESNVFNVFEGKTKDFLKVFSYPKNNATQTCSSTNLSTIKHNSIDYIFTDPPFGANIMYSELNFIQESWLKVLTNHLSEAIQNRTQKKGFSEYSELMLLCFTQFYRILKPGKWMTVEFSNTNASVWNSIQNSLQQAGFVIASLSGLNKKQGSFNAVSSTTAVKQDLVISCYKPSSDFDEKFRQHQHEDVGIWDFVEEHMAHLPIHQVKNKATTAIIERSPKILFDRLIAFYVQRGLPVPIDAANFQKGLRERFVERDGMFFTAEQVQEYDRKKAEVPEFVQLSILVSSEQDGVLWLKNLLEKAPQTYQQIHPLWMKALAGVRKGDIIPELAAILEDNFLSDVSGKWYVPDPEKESDLEKLRTRRLLKQFEKYKDEAAKKKGKIKEVRVEALRTGFRQCYQDKDFKTIVMVGDRIPSNLLMEDEVLLQFYDIASSRV